MIENVKLVARTVTVDQGEEGRLVQFEEKVLPRQAARLAIVELVEADIGEHPDGFKGGIEGEGDVARSSVWVVVSVVVVMGMAVFAVVLKCMMMVVMVSVISVMMSVVMVAVMMPLMAMAMVVVLMSVMSMVSMMMMVMMMMRWWGRRRWRMWTRTATAAACAGTIADAQAFQSKMRLVRWWEMLSIVRKRHSLKALLGIIVIVGTRGLWLLPHIWIVTAETRTAVLAIDCNGSSCKYQ